ncbi:Ferric/cupric reductase transmembrane component 1 [Candida viswanathii]|uniref:ferric-chelate reductase (NADPH) n=1 Tax=Candida viswanathii TaxID=5486 RepID=A0A367YH52_9ASCO|nr:Ferric/cupric reductase transmembrane component 1 [Candida viswanathii]
MNFIYYYLVTALLAAIATAEGEKGASYVPYRSAMGFYACNYEIRRSAAFCKKPVYSCLCADKNVLASFAGCLAYRNRNSTGAVERLVDYCLENGNVTVPEDWFDESYQYFVENAKSASEIPGFNKSVPIDVPIKLPPAQMDLYQEAYEQFLGNFDDSLYYSSAILGFWLLVMIIYAIPHWGKFLFPGLTKKLTSGPINAWRKYISMPATFRKKKSQEQKFLWLFDYLIPSRFETLLIGLFYELTILVNAIRTGYVENDPLYDSKYLAQMRYVSDRTGIMGTMMIPLVILFGGRNNFLQWMTGINFATFMTFHRHIARVMFALVLIHSIGYTILLKGRYAAEAAEPYFYWGIIGTIAAGLICLQAMLYFRRRWYEIFLLIHIVMAALYVAGTWVHVDTLGYIWFVYPAVAVWCFDRLVRIGRLAVFGFPEADVTLLANDTLKVIIPKPSYWKSIPGGHAFIHFIKPTYFWQSHPFTFVDTPDDKNIVLYCKVKGGITHSLYQLLANQPGQTAKIRVGVEGPYGEPTPARYADSAVFIAGGNGIPGIYSEVMDLGRRVPVSTKKVIKLIWIIRDYSGLTWFHEELEALKNTSIQATLYVTRPELSSSDNNSEDKQIESKDNETGAESIKSGLSHIEFRESRPSIGDIVADEVNESSGSIAFVTCGHPVMVDEVRHYACQNIGNAEGKRVDFYEQLQIWA